MNKITLGFLVFPLFLVTVTWSDGAFARGSNETTDLSLGVVYSSQNLSILENPAVLGVSSESEFDASVRMNTGQTDPSVSASFDMNKSTLGVSYDRLSGTDMITGAIGHSFETLKMGINLSTPIKDFNSTSDVGLRLDPTPEIALAVVFRNIFHFNKRTTVGIGLPIGSFVKLEGDALFGEDPSDLSRIRSSFGIEFFTAKKFSLLFRYALQVSPKISTNGSKLQVGSQFWVNPHLALFAILNTPNYSSEVGLKLVF